MYDPYSWGTNTEVQIETSRILAKIAKLKWFNTEVKNNLSKIFGQQIFKLKNSTGYAISINGSQFKQNLKLNELNLTIGSGGIKEERKNIFEESSEGWLLLDLDIQMFYGTIMSQYTTFTHTSLKKLVTILYKMRQVALKEENFTKDRMLKFVINSISGDLANKYSACFDPDARFELVGYAQIFLVNWLDFLVENKCKIYAVDTDGLIIKTEDKNILLKIEK